MKKVEKKTAIVKTHYGPFKAVFETEPDMGGYAVTSPDMQGAVSWGKNMTQAKAMIAEAIEGMVELSVLSEAEKRGEIRFTHRNHRTVSV